MNETATDTHDTADLDFNATNINKDMGKKRKGEINKFEN